GRRCDSKRRIEFDHIVPVARGGKATVEGLRLLCHDHNQYEAEQAFGGEFMESKREEARQARAIARTEKKAREKPPTTAVADAPSPGEAQQVAQRSGALQQTTLETSPGPRKGVRSG
ncbi:MAG TPA: HNH endonuclease signature motif containing protein, partial [Candidatus Eisenbacteria bacterium]|nr:HNH endonuclease signature motif containing protein [Candidatus Eisenbacteria bacterium]